MEEPFKPFTITHVVRNISEWGLYDFCETKEVLQYNVPWKLKIKRDGRHCGVFLKCGRNGDNKEWSIKVKFQVIVLSAAGRTYRGHVEANFTHDLQAYGVNNFITPEQLCDDFAFNDEVIVEAEVTIIEMVGVEKKKKLIAFDDEEAKKMSDVALCVGDEKFYVLKQLLARQSPYFHSMFYKEFKEATMEEILLKDVHPEDFQCFLEVISLEPTLTDDCVEGVLKLADLYEAKNVTRQCEEFLMHKSNHSDKKLLQMVGRFNLSNLREQVFDNIRSKTDVRAATDPKQEDPEILRRLLDMALQY